MPLLTALAALATAAGGPPLRDEPPAPPASAQPAPAAPAPAGPPLLATLLGGASLGPGAAVWTLAAGYPYLLVAYGQGAGESDDYGAVLEIDWTASEFVVGGFWRREIASAGRSHLALRFRVGFYACFGGTYVWSDNQVDRGAQAAAGVAWSLDTSAGVLSVAGDVPAAWTFLRGGGWVTSPHLAASFEAPLWHEVSVGARAGAGLRGAGGGAPGAGKDRVLAEVTALVTYRLF